jgi:hypothetical protein
METIARTIQLLAHRIESEGFGDDSLDLLVMAHAARDLHVNEILVQVMIDDREPEVARERAFAMVARAMDSATDLDLILAERIERPLAIAC